MGYDIVAYFHVNQEEIEDFINENKIERDNVEKEQLIVDYYKSKNQTMKDLRIIYEWNEECRLHKFYDCYRTTFIRNDRRFSMKNLPECLTDINHNLDNANAETAIEIAEALEIYFTKDEKLQHFAEWLKTTSKHCFIYGLSY